MKRTLNLKFLAILLLTTALFGVGVHFLHAFQLDRNVEALRGQAERAQAAQDFQTAINYFGRYLGFVPTDTDVLARYAFLLDDQGKEAKAWRQRARAARLLETVLRQDEKRLADRRRLAKLEMDLGWFSDAKAHLLVLLQSSPKDGELYQRLGLCEQADKKYAAAVESYQKAVEHSRHTLDNYLRLAVVYRQGLELPQKADEILDAMVKWNGTSFQAYLERALQRIRAAGQKADVLKAAAADVQKARELAPNELRVILTAAELAQAQGNPQEARTLLRQAVKMHPKDARVYLSLIVLEVKSEDAPKALQAARQGLEQLPQQNDLLHALGDLLVQQGQLKETAEVIARLRKAKYSRPLVDYLEARLHILKGEWGQGEKLLAGVRPALSEVPNLAKQADILLGRCYERLGNPDQALLAYQEAVKRDPLSMPARLGVGGAYAGLNRLDEAATEYRQVLAFAKAPALTRLLLTRVLLVKNLRTPIKNRDWSEIKEQLRRASKELPDSVEVPILQAEALVQENPKQRDPARKLLEKARDARPERVELWIALANLAGAEKSEEALRLVDEAERQPKLRGNADLQIARIRYLARLPEKEARARLAALEKQVLPGAAPEVRQRYLGAFADAYYRTGANKEAMQLWGKLAAEQPNNLVLRLWLFDLALLDGRDAEADRLLAEVRRIEGESGVFWRYGEASLAVQQARPKDQGTLDARAKLVLRKASNYLADVRKWRPSWYRVPALEGAIDDLEGRQAHAIDNYQQAVNLGERRPGIVRRLVQLLYEHRRFDEADKAIKKLMVQERVLLTAGLAKLATESLLRQQDQSRALDLAMKSVSPQSKDYLDHLWLGQVLWSLGKHDEAKKALGTACKLASTKGEAWTTLVVFLAATDQKNEAEAALEKARKALPADQAPLALGSCYEAVGKLKEAESQLQAALAARPGDVTTVRNVAAFYLRTLQMTKAEGLLRKMLAPAASAPADQLAWARRNLAFVLASGIDHRRFQEALDLVEKNLKAGGGADDQRVKAMLLASRMSQRKEAIRLFEDIQRQQPLRPDERFQLARLYNADGNWPSAQRTILALLGSPLGKDPTFYAWYARRLLQRGELGSATDWLSRLEKLEPESLRTVEIKARVLKAKGADQEAVAVVNAYAERNKANLGLAAFLLEVLGRGTDGKEIYRKRAEEVYQLQLTKEQLQESFLAYAEFLGRNNRLKEALERCEQALKKGPPEAAVALGLAILRSASAGPEHRQRVEQWIQSAIKESADPTRLQVSLADLRDLQGQYQEAAAIYRQLLAKSRRNLVALNNLAWYLAVKEGKGSEALTLIQEGIDLVGSSPELLDTRGVIYLAARQKDKAVADLERAVTMSASPSRYFHLAQAQLVAGNRDAAIIAFQRARTGGLTEGSLHPLERGEYQRLQTELKLR